MEAGSPDQVGGTLLAARSQELSLAHRLACGSMVVARAQRGVR